MLKRPFLWRVFHWLGVRLENLGLLVFPAFSSATAPAVSASSAPLSTPGPVMKQSPSGFASREEIGEHIRRVITEAIKSTKFTGLGWTESWIDSSTLQLTLRWPMPFTSIGTDGVPGRVGLERSPTKDSPLATACWKCETLLALPNQILCGSCLREATLLMEHLIDTGQLVFQHQADNSPPSGAVLSISEPL